METTPDRNLGKSPGDVFRQQRFTAESATDDSVSLPDGPEGMLLAEQLVEFANAAFVFNTAQARPPAKPDPNATHFPALPKSYFADIEPIPLTNLHLKNTRVLPSREQMVALLPKGGVCIALGTRTGDFARRILSELQPSKLFLCDRDFHSFDDGTFAIAIDQGVAELHECDDGEHLATLPDRHFDLINIHSDHSYIATARALEQAGRKVKDDGCIVCANYTAYAPLEGTKCGVARAVNEFCHVAGFEIAYLALHPLGYQDVALRKRAASTEDEEAEGASLETPDSNTFLPEIWDYLIDKYQICSVLDVGAGAGWSTKWFASRGVYTLGVEGSSAALEKSQCRGNIIHHDYRSGPFVPSMLLDLAWCAGFVEQIDEEFIPNFMASFRSCQFVCLLHREPGPRNAHRVNCRPTEYWVKKMNEFGFDNDEVETAHLRATDSHRARGARRTLTFFKKRN